MVREDKKQQVKEIKERFEQAQVAVLTDYRGLDAQEITDLRRVLREAGVDFKVIKNTLARLAIRECQLEELERFLTGPTAVAFGFDDPIVAAKILSDFSKEHEALKIKGGLLERKVIEVSEIKALANLPSREELIARLVGILKTPLIQFTSVLMSPLYGLRNILDQLAKRDR